MSMTKFSKQRPPRTGRMILLFTDDGYGVGRFYFAWWGCSDEVPGDMYWYDEQCEEIFGVEEEEPTWRWSEIPKELKRTAMESRRYAYARASLKRLREIADRAKKEAMQ